MKKYFIFTLLMSFILFCSCTTKKENVGFQQDNSFLVKNIISMDRENMYNLSGGDYKWYETMILLDNYLDEENDGSIAEIVNVFQAIKNYNEKSFDTKVYKFQHFADGTYATDSIDGFWIEDYPLEDSLIKVPYEKAFELVQEVNLPKPHSRHACLRKPVGPRDCNPQWVFGNLESQIWIDAVTGEARNSNPAFPDGFKYAFTW